MARLRLFGADYSVYVRIARLALEEKRVTHDLVPVDVFAPDGVPDWYGDIHPFGRIPALDDNGFVLFETSAITRYVDEAFDGPDLQPPGPAARARMNQAIAMLDQYGYAAMVWGVYVERVAKPEEGKPSDEARIAAALPVARKCLETLESLKGGGDWLAGGALSLADLHAAPMLACFAKAPEGKEMLDAHAGLGDWWARLAARDSFKATEPGS
ncbi:MAG: glutathione S-transferase family protein [Pseudomonadota bacterium]|nr:glutathione S-transferase family protein [Pseudomonadota bacterium]